MHVNPNCVFVRLLFIAPRLAQSSPRSSVVRAHTHTASGENMLPPLLLSLLYTAFLFCVVFACTYYLWPLLDRTVPLIKTSTAIGARISPLENILLLGDSMLDNESYLSGGEAAISVAKQTAAVCRRCRVVLAAIDGATTEDITLQMANVHRLENSLDAARTLAVLSIGGNDALRAAQRCMRERTFLPLVVFVRTFARVYEETLVSVLRAYPRIAVLNVYVPRVRSRALRCLLAPAVRLLNGKIHRVARRHRVPVLDVFTLFSEAADYANPIEPSEHGGYKIADLIARAADTLRHVPRRHWIERGRTRLSILQTLSFRSQAKRKGLLDELESRVEKTQSAAWRLASGSANEAFRVM